MVHDRVAHLREVVVEHVDHLVRAAAVSAKVVKPRRSLNRTVPSRRTPARRRSSSARSSTSSTTVLGDEAGEGVADPLALVGGDQGRHRERADRREDEGGERIDDGDDPARPRRRAGRGRRRARPRSDRRREGDQRAQPELHDRAEQAEEDDQGDVEISRGPTSAGSRSRRSRSRWRAFPAPAISWPSLAGVASKSCSEGAVAPTTTVLPRKAASGTLPRRTSENE